MKNDSKIRSFHSRLERNTNGELEEFTSDVTDVSAADSVDHLSPDGIAKTGTQVVPGLILIGKIGVKDAEAKNRMNEFERMIASEDELRAYYSAWLYDASTYAPENCFGTMVDSRIEKRGDAVSAEVIVQET